MRKSDVKLATALREAGLPGLAGRAVAGEFNEFFGPHAAPELLLADLLREAGTPSALAVLSRLVDGEFDADNDESEEWARSAEGKAAIAELMRPPQTIGDAPIEEQYREMMKSLALYIDRFFNGPEPGRRETGFILMTFAFGDDKGRCNYISNARRDEVVVLLKEQLARFEGQPEISGRA